MSKRTVSGKVNQKKKTTGQQTESRESIFLRYKNRWGWIIGGAYTLVMAIITFSYHKIGDYGVETDFFWSYVTQAQSFMDGHIIIDKYRGPLYPMVLGLVHLLTGEYFTAGLLIGLISAGLTLFFTYQSLSSLFSEKVAWITTLLVSVNTTFNLYTYSAGTDMFFMMLVSGTIYFIVRNPGYHPLNLALAGFFAGAAYLTRYNGIFLPIGLIIGLLFINIYRLIWKKRLEALAYFLAVFIVVIAPWGVYTYQKKGKAFFNQNYQNVAYEYLAKDKMGWDEFWYQGNRDKYTGLLPIILDQPGRFLGKMFSNAFDHLKRDLSSLTGWHIAVFSILGLLLMFYAPPDRFQWFYYLLNVLFFGVLLLVFYNERFSMFLIPFYTVIGINALFTPNKFLKETISGSSTLTFILAGVLVIWSFSKSYAYNSENINSGDKNLYLMAREFKKRVPENQRHGRIHSRKPHIAYYLGLEKKYIPPVKDYYKLVTLLWKNNVDYVYYGFWEQGMGLDFLKDPNNLPPDFELFIYTSAKNKIIRQKPDSHSPYKIETARINQPAFLYRVRKDSIRINLIHAGEEFIQKTGLSDNPESSQIKVMAAVPYFPYYTGTSFLELPRTSMNELYQKMDSLNVSYLVFSPFEAGTRFELGQLIFVNNAPEWLEPFIIIEPDSRYPVIIYRFKPYNSKP